MDEAKAAREKAAASQQPAPDLSKAARRLEQRFTDVDFWAEQTAKCLSCGACTYMCPTCQCFNISDEGDPLEGRRLRSWDNCMSPLFTREASGHNPRTAKAMRAQPRFAQVLVRSRLQRRAFRLHGLRSVHQAVPGVAGHP